jgi:uncharacterized membrane protein YfcA
MDIGVGILAGLIAGTISGMLGVGGGTVTIPAMVLLLDVEQHTAQGVALGAMLVTAAVGAFVHHRQGNVDVRAALWIAPTAEWLTRVFAIALLFIGARMLLFSRGGKSVGTG